MDERKSLLDVLVLPQSVSSHFPDLLGCGIPGGPCRLAGQPLVELCVLAVVLQGVLEPDNEPLYVRELGSASPGVSMMMVTSAFPAVVMVMVVVVMHSFSLLPVHTVRSFP
jgi:hypothetical protein